MAWTIRDSARAFDAAIEAGYLNTNQNSVRCVSKYMYMYTDASGADSFKHIITRQYLKVPAKN